MKMIQGTGTISNYGSYVNNCQRGQMPYKIPVNLLNDVQLYIDIGVTKPDAIQYQLIHTCGPLGGTIETLTTSVYVVGQNTNNSWYGVFKGFDPVVNPISCFVIAITLTFGEIEWIFFSDEYCIEANCGTDLVLIKGCYGILDNKISYNCQGIYFGTHAGTQTPMGDTTVNYRHQLFLRDTEVTLSAIKNSFKQGRTRNFRTEKEKIYQFMAELVPEWYIDEVDSVFYRGEVYVGTTRYLVNETQFEKIEECKRMWKPFATLKDSCYQSFNCDADPCAEIPETPCCEPQGVSATVTADACCIPEIVSATTSTM
jgi:hypothetical protein